MKPEGIRKVIAEKSLEGAIIYLAEQIEAGSVDRAHDENSVVYQLQGKIDQLEDRVAQLEGAASTATESPSTPASSVQPAGEGA